MFISYQNGKIVGYTEEPQDLILYNLDKVEETDKEYVLDGNQFVLKDEQWKEKQAEIERKELFDDLYKIKAEKAYGGVIINDSLVFETNQIAITNTIASIALMKDDSIASWKFYALNGKPFTQLITKLQLLYIAQFGQDMINRSFKIEGDYNAILEQATTEDLNNPTWVENFKSEVEVKMGEVNNRLMVEFNQTEEI